LLDWATSEHQKGNIGTANLRYDWILEAPSLNDSIKEETERKHAYSIKGVRLPTVAEFVTSANNQPNSSSTVYKYVEGYELYPGNEQLRTGINQSIRSLLLWVNGQHQKGNIGTARTRYELILESPGVYSSIRRETQMKLDYALDNKKLPTPDELINSINNENNSSQKLAKSIEGYYLYPGNEKLTNAINDSAASLMSWATTQHLKGELDTARVRYERVLDSPSLNSKIEKEVRLKLKYVNKNEILPTEQRIIDVANSKNSSSKAIEILTKGYYLYPNSTEISAALNMSARNLLEWAKDQHQKGQFGTAIHRYNYIIGLDGVYNSTQNEAKKYLKLAEAGEKIAGVKDIVNGKVAEYSYNQMISDIKALESSYSSIIETKIIGKSVDYRNLYAVKLGKGKKEIFINASHHAREHMTTNVIMEMIDEYAKSYALDTKYHGYDARQILNEVSIWFVPMVNPDGVMLVQEGALSASNPSNVIEINGGSSNFSSWKANIRGVDLNRQYPYLWNSITDNTGKPSSAMYKGVLPLSEPETKAVYDFTNQHNFLAAVSYHSSGELIYTRYGFSSHTRKITAGVANITGYQPIDLQNSVSGGGYTDWFLYKKNQPAITQEISPYVYEQPVPFKNWDGVWNKNKTVGLYIAKYTSDR
ncbi:M14 family metallocarboxypeptidase, partial [Paraliobacillus sp. X-1268]|uniref:M14 family metallopeptidase n=1 Tax=Paraliobacillus sp. X-1268 TaxID=2213193 RepID=UPI0018E4E4DE